jgi:methionyl-tRNA formyltransferase
MSIVFIGTPSFAVPSLRRLAESSHTVSAVITQPDRPAGRDRRVQAPPVKLAAQELGLPVLQPPSLRDPAAVAALQEESPEAIVVVAYGQLLRPHVLDIPARGVLNVHPSLLPRWRGASPIPAAILAGDDQTGVTIMIMDEGMDSGPILSQTALPIVDADTTASLSERLANVGADLLIETLPRWLSGEVEAVAQDSDRATTCPLVRKDDGVINWSLPALDIWRRVRAYNPWPGAATALDGQMLHIWQAWPLQARTESEPGTVVSLSDESARNLPEERAREARFAVQTGDGLLVPLEIQRAGRRTLGSAEFQRGVPNLLGRRLS